MMRIAQKPNIRADVMMPAQAEFAVVAVEGRLERGAVAGRPAGDSSAHLHHGSGRLMAEHQIRRLPVVEGKKLVGIVSLGDLAVKEGRDTRIGETLEEISEGVKRMH